MPKLLRARGEYAGGRETSRGDYGIDDAETVNGEKIRVDESKKPKPMTATCPPGETSAALIRGGRRGAARPFDGLLSVGIARGGGRGNGQVCVLFSCWTRRTRATTTSNDVLHGRRTTGNSRAFEFRPTRLCACQAHRNRRCSRRRRNSLSVRPRSQWRVCELTGPRR